VYYYLLAVAVLIVDQVTKAIIISQLKIGERIPVIGEFFQITSHRNAGAAFGVLSGQRWFFLVVTTIVAGLLIWYIRSSYSKGLRLAPLAYCLILGGAIGNFIDRVRFGEVVDFLKFRFQFDWFGSPVDYTYPIFNVADSAIVIGVIMAIIQLWRERKEEPVKQGSDAV
jgi:signal peptidase II